MGNILLPFYKFVRRPFRGKGLSKYHILRNVNLRLERFLRGAHKEFITVKGLKFFLDPQSSITEKGYERVNTEIIEASIKEGDIFVDIGACIGWFSIIASRKVGPGGKVYAFEPNPNSFRLLKKNIAANNCYNIIAENLAVSNTEKETTLYVVGNLWLGSSLFDPRENPDLFITPHFADDEDKTVREYKVNEVSLGFYFEKLEGKIDFIKIDAEGMDGLVFDGMKEIIKNNPQIKILMEFVPTISPKFGFKVNEFVEMVKKMGFNVFVTDDKNIKPLISIPTFACNFFLSKDRMNSFPDHLHS